MGLSSKQVVISTDGLDWTHNFLQAHHQPQELPKQQQQQQQPPLIRRQQNQQQAERLKCPRCDSTNTKFCYYNNYNKSQPRHFCKACKRHWTKGGTLRNVPVGGGRKNKRLKTSKTTASTTTAADPVTSASPATSTACTTTTGSSNISIINRVNSHLPLVIGDHKSLSEILYQALISPITASSTSGLQQNSINNGILSGSNSSLPQAHAQGLNFSYPHQFQSSSVYNYTGEGMEDSTITTISTSMPSTSSTIALPCQVPNTSYWNWDDDIDNLVSSTDLNIPWDDPEIKP